MACRKSPAEFAARRRQSIEIIFSRDMCVRENTCSGCQCGIFAVCGENYARSRLQAFCRKKPEVFSTVSKKTARRKQRRSLHGTQYSGGRGRPQYLRPDPHVSGEGGLRRPHRRTTAARPSRSLKSRRPDLVLLDIMLPVMDGWAGVPPRSGRPARSPSSCSPPRARSTTGSPGLEMGADDYIVKPFEMKELHGPHQRGAAPHARSPTTPSKEADVRQAGHQSGLL